MTTRRLLLLAFVGALAWGLYVVADRVVEAAWRALASGGEHAWSGNPGTHDPRDWDVIVDLSGAWDFRIGTAPPSSSTEAGWDQVSVPGAWENEGYFGYDGFAWYRKTFTVDERTAKDLQDGPVFLLLGRIDDADEVWLNGVYLGRSGRMPPTYKTAAFGFREYHVPPDLLRYDGENVVTVHVYDEGLEGGILEGAVGLALPTSENPAGTPLVADLSGVWQFRLGDAVDGSAPDAAEAEWDSLRVPAMWDVQGYGDYDGVAWYRTTVTLSAPEAAQDLILVMGAVDDLDQTFVNGVEVGATGDVDSRTFRGDEWMAERAYPVPRGLLTEGENVVAVRVYDGVFDGGIYRGPVGLMTPEAYAERRERAR